MVDKLLTVVVPTYNMEKYLDRCLSSLVINDELMEHLEVLVVNDGSKDRSSEIAHSFEAKYPETFRVIDKENGNYGSCINRGISEATGKYFRILDADDYYCTDAFQSFVSKLDAIDVDMVVTPFLFIGKDEEHTVSISREVQRNTAYDITEVNPDSIPLHMHSMTFRHRTLVDGGVQLSTGVSYTDTEYCFLPLPFIRTLAFEDDEVYNYNADREGQTCSTVSMAKSTYSMYVVASRLIEHYQNNVDNVNTNVRRLWEKWLLQICGVYYRSSLALCVTDDDARLREVDSKVRTIPFLEAYISELCIHHIHYVRMWRNKGRRYTHPLVRIHDAVWQVVDPIWLQLLKWFCPSKL